MRTILKAGLLQRNHVAHVYIDGPIIDLEDDAGRSTRCGVERVLSCHVVADQLILEDLTNIDFCLESGAILGAPRDFRRRGKLPMGPVLAVMLSG